MFISREKAATEEAPTTVLTSSTTLPIVREAADAPASMREGGLVDEAMRRVYFGGEYVRR